MFRENQEPFRRSLRPLDKQGDSPLLRQINARGGGGWGVPRRRRDDRTEEDKQRERDYWDMVYGRKQDQKPVTPPTPIKKERTPSKKQPYTKDNIILGCGCPATVLHYPDGRTTTYPHHKRGCKGDED